MIMPTAPIIGKMPWRQALEVALFVFAVSFLGALAASSGRLHDPQDALGSFIAALFAGVIAYGQARKLQGGG